MTPVEQQSSSLERNDTIKRHIGEVVPLSLGGSYDFTVRWASRGLGSHWDPRTRTFQFDSKILDYANINATMGVIAHEPNHELFSDLEEVMDVWPELGFKFGFNAAEDPRANQGGITFFPGTREWIRAYIEIDLGPGGGLDYKGLKEDAEDSLGYVPKFMQAGAEFIRYWYEREFKQSIADPRTSPQQFHDDMTHFLEEVPDQEVRDLITTIQPYLEEYIRMLPKSMDKAERKRTAREAGRYYKRNIWPEYKKLVDQSFKENSMVQMIKDMIQQDGQQEGGQIIMVPFDALPPDVQDEIKEKMREQAKKKREKIQQAAGQHPNPEDQQAKQPHKGRDQQEGMPTVGTGAEGEADGQNGAGGIPQEEGESEDKTDQQFGDGGASQTGAEYEQEEGKPDEEQQTGQQEGQSPERAGAEEGSAENGEAAGAAGEDGEKEDGDLGDQVPWDKLSDEAKEAIEDVYDNQLSDNEKESLEEKAQRELEDAEDKASEKMKGKMLDPKQTESHKERRQRKRREERERHKQEAKKMIEKVREREREAKKHLIINHYQEFRQRPDVNEMVRKWKHKFTPIFEPTADPERRYASSGVRLNIKRVMDYRRDRRKNSIFEKEGCTTARDYHFTILVDLSRSMQMGGKIEETFKVVVALSELLDRYGIEFEIWGFTDSFRGNVRLYKGFEDRHLTKPIKEQIGMLYKDCISHGGGTPTYEATKAAYAALKERFQRRPSKNNYFITLTDGQCTSTSEAEMIGLIQDIAREHLAIPVGFGIGPGTAFTNNTYPILPREVRRAVARSLKEHEDTVSNSFTNLEEFGKAFVVIVEQMIRFPERFFQASR